MPTLESENIYLKELYPAIEADPLPSEWLPEVLKQKPVKFRHQKGKQELFGETNAKVSIYGGAAGGGKSYACLLEPLRHLEKPGFTAAILRRTIEEIMLPGGLWHTAMGIYPVTGARINQVEKTATWYSGAQAKFSYIMNDERITRWQSSQITLTCFDELTHFTEFMFKYMLSRSRSTCGVSPYVRATCNPEKESWLREFIDWWIGSDGFAIPERCGAIRWLVVHKNQNYWFNNPEEARSKFPEALPLDISFISATLDDNPKLIEADPGYRANLNAFAAAFDLAPAKQRLHRQASRLPKQIPTRDINR